MFIKQTLMLLDRQNIAYITVILALFSTMLFINTAHAGGTAGLALESTQQENRAHLSVIEEMTTRMRIIMDYENPAQFQASAAARRGTAEATMEEFLTGDDGNPMFIERYGQEKEEVGDIVYQEAIVALAERYESPYLSTTQGILTRNLQSATYSLTPESEALARGETFTWEAVRAVVRDPGGQTGLGQHFAATREVQQARDTAEANFQDEAIANNLINPVREDCDENGLNCRTAVPAAMVERIANDAATAGSRLQELGDTIGEEVESSFAGMDSDIVRGSSATLGIGEDLGMNTGDLFDELGLDPSDFGLDPDAIFSDIIDTIAGEFGIGNIDLSSPEAAAQSIVSALGEQMGISGLDITDPEAFSQSVADIIGAELGINIDLSSPDAAAQSVMNAIGSELGVGDIDLSSPEAMQDLINAALAEIGSGQSTDFSDPTAASDIIQDAAGNITSSSDTDFSTTEVSSLIDEATTLEEEHYALIQQAQNSGSADLQEYVNSAEEGELSLANQVMNNIVTMNDLSLELQTIQDEASGDYTDEQVSRVSDIISEYSNLYSELSDEADIQLLEQELANI